MFRHDNERPTPRPSGRGGLWSLAALSVAALCCSVLGARLLAEMVEKGDVQAIVSNRPGRPLRQLAASAPRAQPREAVTVVRSVGVDGVTTATVSNRSGASQTPCGETSK